MKVYTAGFPASEYDDERYSLLTESMITEKIFSSREKAEAYTIKFFNDNFSKIEEYVSNVSLDYWDLLEEVCDDKYHNIFPAILDAYFANCGKKLENYLRVIKQLRHRNFSGLYQIEEMEVID